MNKKLLVKDIMTQEVIFVSPEDGINEVAEKLTRNRIHGIPIVENDKVIGIITETDFFTKSFPGLYLPSYIDFLKDAEFVDAKDSEHRKKVKELINSKAKDIMTSPCVTVSPDTEISNIIDLMKIKQFVTLPVVDNQEKLVGIITIADIIKLI
jgi:CBS domain-containing protein